MKNQRFIIFVSLLLMVSCSSPVKEQDTSDFTFIPDNTPFIAGFIEATNDTVHHYPEVIVGYFTNEREYLLEELYQASDPSPDVYSPDLLTQLVKTMNHFKFVYESEEQATVTVTGPLNHPRKKEVIYTNQSNGLYGDVNAELPLLAGENYRIDIELPDGRAYSSTTVIPSSVEIEIPDSIGIELYNAEYSDGTPVERFLNEPKIFFEHPEETHLVIVQNNTDKDRDLLLMEPDDEFMFYDRGNFLRAGSLYGISLTREDTDTLSKSWVQRLDKPRSEIWEFEHNWMRLSFFSDGIYYLHPMMDEFSTYITWSETINNELLDAIDNRDSTYLFDTSTIRKVGEDGQLLPKEATDAIGFFAGYFSVYDQTTLYPIRQFDLDSLLSAYADN